MSEPRPSRLGRARRALTGAAIAAGLASVFVIATVGGIAAHLDSPTSRRLVQRVVNFALGSVFEGKIVVEQLDHISIRGVEVGSAVVLDPEGRTVIRASGIRGRANVLGIARNVLFGSGDIKIVIPYARVEHGNVLLELRPSKRVDLEEAFALKHKATPEPPGAPRRRGRLVSVELSHIEVGTAWVHGEIAPPRSLDADVSRLAGTLRAGPDGVVLDVEQTGLVDRSFLPAPTSGTANYHLRAEPIRMWTSFVGQIGDVDVTARGELDEKHLSATADAPKASPEQLATVLPVVPVAQPVALHAEIDGPIPQFDVVTRIEALATHGSVDAQGKLDASGPTRLELDAHADDVDPRLFAANLPDAHVIAGARVRVELGGVLPRVAADGHSDPTIVGTTPVPAADVHVIFDRGVLSGTTTVYEPGIPVDGAFTVTPGEGLRFDARSRIDAIHAAPRIAGPVDGSARVRVAGKLQDGVLDANVDASFSSLKTPGNVSVGEGRVTGRVRGPLNGLSLDATASAHRMVAGGYAFDDVKAHARGPLASPRLDADLKDADRGYVHATGRLDARGGAVRDVDVEVGREGDVVKGQIKSIAAKSGGVAVEGIALKGDAVGDAKGTLVVHDGDVTGTLKGEGVDLERLGRLAGFPYRVKGIANVDVALERGPKGRNGHVQVELEDGQVLIVPGLSMHLTATVKDDQLEADGLVRLVAHDDAKDDPPDDGKREERCAGSIAQVRLSNGKAALRGPLLAASTWRALTGSAEIAAENWNLRCLKRLVPIGLPISDIGGFADARAEVSREAGARFITIKDAELKTRNLQVIGPQGLRDDAPAWESRSLDVSVKADLDGNSGKTRAQVALYDDALVASASAELDVDLPKALDPRTRWEAIANAPLSARLDVPRRPIASFKTLPSMVSDRLPPMAGDVRFDGYVDGTIKEPFVALRAIGWGLAYSEGAKSAEESRWALPVDVDTLTTYDAEKATLDAHVTHNGAEILAANAEITAKLADLVHYRSGQGPLPWRAGLYAKLKEVPLGEIPFFSDHDIGGHVNGTMSIAREPDHSSLAVDLELPDLQVGQDLYFEGGKLTASVAPTADGKSNIGKAEVSLVSQDGGRLDLSSYAGIDWKKGLVPTVDPESAGMIAAKVSRFRLAAFYPLVSSVLSKLDGYMDGSVQLDWSRVSEGDRGSLDADLTVTEGAFHVPQIGQEFKHAHVRVEAISDRRRDALRKSSGHPTTMQCGPRVLEESAICFHDLGAEGISGVVRGWALARMDGLRLRGDEQEHAGTAAPPGEGSKSHALPIEGELEIAKGEELPITVEGVPVGKARGTFVITAAKHDNTIAMSVGVSRMHLDLPASSRKDVQPLDENPDFAVSHALGPDKEARSPDALNYTVDLKLGDVRIEGTSVDVRVTSNDASPPHVELTDKVHVTGDIQLVEGSKFEVFGKQFEIERGIVRMRAEDAGNPYLNVTAFWDAPDGTRIYADYIGILKPVTNQKLRFRSNPPHTQQELVAALLFGADLSHDTGSGAAPGAGGAAAGVVGGIGSDQFNALLSGIPLLNRISTRIGSNEEGQLKTSLVYQVSERVSLTASFEGTSNSTSQASGTTTTTTPGGSASQKTSRTEGSIDWHFSRHWLLRGTVGVESSTPTSGVDLLWQYRY